MEGVELEAHNQKDCIEGRVGVDVLVNEDVLTPSVLSLT